MDIVCHMITSLDGCILLERWSKPAERVDFTQVYEATAKRLQGDGWIVGRITMAEYGQGVVEGEPAGMRGRGESVPRAYVGDRQDRPLAVVFDPKGRLQFSKNGLPTGTDYPAEALAKAALADKKRSGDSITIVVPKAIGDCELKRIPVTELLPIIAAGRGE